jgi:hypothetical protein
MTTFIDLATSTTEIDIWSDQKDRQFYLSCLHLVQPCASGPRPSAVSLSQQVPQLLDLGHLGPAASARCQGRPVERVVIPRVSCPRCHQQGILALPDGQPRPHLRDTCPGEQMYSSIVPTKTDCGG